MHCRYEQWWSMELLEAGNHLTQYSRHGPGMIEQVLPSQVIENRIGL